MSCSATEIAGVVQQQPADLDWSSLHVSLMLGVCLVAVNTVGGLAVTCIRPKWLHGEWTKKKFVYRIHSNL